MNIINSIKDTITPTVGKALCKLEKVSPEILIGVGIVGMVTSTVLACKATKKAEKVMEEHRESIKTIDSVSNLVEDGGIDADAYTKEDRNKDLFIAYVQTGVKLLKVYGPSIAVGALSVACFVGSNHVLKTRNVALMAAFSSLSEEFGSYRDKVKKEIGEEKEKDILAKSVKVHGSEEDLAKMTEQERKTWEAAPFGRYTRYFDESSREWVKNADYNKAFLTCQQNAANDRLRSRGVLFLNEVYDMLGFDPTPEGAIVGWVLNRNNEQYVDFGMYNGNNQGNRMFINGDNRYTLLDFNVQGVVFDML